LALLIFGLFVALIVGLVKPQLVLFWSKKPTRLKVFGWWFLLTFILGIFFTALSPEKTSEEIVNSSRKSIEKGDYKSAISELKKIGQGDSLYFEAQTLIAEADSLLKITEIEKVEKTKQSGSIINTDSINLDKTRTHLRVLLEEFQSGEINKVSFESQAGLQEIMISIKTWSKAILENENSTDSISVKSAKELRKYVTEYQKKNFPKIRKQCAKVMAENLWEHDAYVTTAGSRNEIVNFSAGLFAANKNIKDFHEQTAPTLKMYRFKEFRYRWYKEASEYTYYKETPPSDDEIVVIN
jgi:hypothetical protein